MTSVLLNAVFNAGNKIGPILCWVFILLMLLEIVYVWIRYVMTSNK